MFLVSSCSCLCPIHWSQCKVKNEDVVGTAPTGDVPTTSEWSTILLPTKVRLTLDVWKDVHHQSSLCQQHLQIHNIVYLMINSDLDNENRFDKYSEQINILVTSASWCFKARMILVFGPYIFLATPKQLYEWFILSVRLSHLFHYVPFIVSSWNFQELLPMTEVRSMQKVKVRGQRSRSQR